MAKPRLLYYSVLEFHPDVLRGLEERYTVHVLPDPGCDEPQILAEMDVVLAPLGYLFDAAKMDACRRLRVIASSTLRTPHVDRAAARERGIAVACLENEPAMLGRITATAELAWGLVICLTRHLPWAVAAALEGDYGGRPWGRKTPRMLSRMSLGVVGLGRLGSLVAGYGRAFGMAVRYVSPHSTDPTYERCADLADLAARSDVVSLHAQVTPETMGMIGAEFFAALRPGAFFVNTARGELVDESALLAALESGQLAGAALDVLAGMHQPGFAQRVADHPLVRYARAHANLIITPYYAGATQDAWAMTQSRTMDLAWEALAAHPAHSGAGS